jgi:hypothetical protein
VLLLMPLLLSAQVFEKISTTFDLLISAAAALLVFNFIVLLVYFVKRKSSLAVILRVTGFITPFGGFIMLMFGDQENEYIRHTLFCFWTAKLYTSIIA